MPRNIEIYNDRPTHRLRPCTIQSLFHGLRFMVSLCTVGLCRTAYDLHTILRIEAFYSYSLWNLSTMDVHRQISVARALLCPHPAYYDFHESAFHAISVLYRMYVHTLVVREPTFVGSTRFINAFVLHHPSTFLT